MDHHGGKSWLRHCRATAHIKHRSAGGVLDAELQLWNHTFGYVKSMALKTALDLRIPDAIHQHGGSATLPQIVTRVTLHPSKTPCLRRLMRVLTLTGVFSAQQPHDDGGGCDVDDELVYRLTPASRLLVGSSGQNVSPFLTLMLGPIFVSTFLDLREWFQHETPDPSPFKMTHGREIWELAAHDAAGFGSLFDAGMVADSVFIVMDVVVRECAAVFQGISSLVDVAGGFGGATQAIAKAFPHLECSVMDLPNVVAGAPADTGVKFVAGDMFESVPSADAVFLKAGVGKQIQKELITCVKSDPTPANRKACENQVEQILRSVRRRRLICSHFIRQCLLEEGHALATHPKAQHRLLLWSIILVVHLLVVVSQ